MIIESINSIIEGRKQFISKKNVIYRGEEAFESAYKGNIFCIGETVTNVKKMNNLSINLIYILSNDWRNIRKAHKSIENVRCNIFEQSLFDNV